MKQKTATQVAAEEYRYNLRKTQVNVILSQMLAKIEANNVECDLPQLHRVLAEFLDKNGFHIISDEDRDRLGLEPRDDHGWTLSQRLEEKQRKLSALNALITPTHSR